MADRIDRQPVRARSCILGLLTAAAVTTAALAATTGYKYDALGRLIEVTHDNGNVVTYTLDAAGNRTQVSDWTPQGPPASITVPSTSSTGNYTVSWTYGGTVSSYELYESTSANFATQTKVYQGAGTSASISGHAQGTFYYRVRGCNGSSCTDYLASSNAITITLPPPPPTNLAKNQTSPCDWQASWSKSEGATSYVIRDQSGEFQYSVPAPGSSPTVTTSYSFCGVPYYSGVPWDYRPKWVKACVGATCSAQVNFP